jgi:transposase
MSGPGVPQPVGVSSQGFESSDGGAVVDMTAKELDRLGVIQLVLARRLKYVKAGTLLGISARQVARLCDAYQRHGAAGLVSRKRGRVGNRKLPADIEAQVVELARRFYQGSGPTLVRDKLAERHGIKLAKETIRKILSRAGLWSPKSKAGPSIVAK